MGNIEQEKNNVEREKVREKLDAVVRIVQNFSTANNPESLELALEALGVDSQKIVEEARGEVRDVLASVFWDAIEPIREGLNSDDPQTVE
ncbi:MAG: hypothetical protein D6780_03250, partial [Candidatus Dadabacteria bacterium]